MWGGGDKVDILKLEYEIKKRGYTVNEFLKLVSIGKSAYYRKRAGTSEFTQGEIQKIVDALDLESPMGIFFTAKVS